MAKLYFRYGAMNSGKTTSLLQTAHNYEERGQRVVLVKACVDTKGDDTIVSRLGVSRRVDILLSAGDDVRALVRALDPRGPGGPGPRIRGRPGVAGTVSAPASSPLRARPGGEPASHHRSERPP